MELTQNQLDFLSGSSAAQSPAVWMPLLEAGLIVPNPHGGPPMFLVTAKGRPFVPSRVHYEITGIKSEETPDGDIHRARGMRQL